MTDTLLQYGLFLAKLITVLMAIGVAGCVTVVAWKIWQIVGEPSIHATGSLYTWKTPLPKSPAELPHCPPAFLASIAPPLPLKSGVRSDHQRFLVRPARRG